MDPLTPDIRKIRPTDPRIAPLIDGHLAMMRASSPACSVHAMEADALAESGAHLYAIFERDAPVAIGAVKRIDAMHCELKSMHVRTDIRRNGLGRAILTHLLQVARDAGFQRVSLETGSQPPFAPARAMYSAAGFNECPAFEGYGPDPNSVFMTKTL